MNLVFDDRNQNFESVFGKITKTIFEKGLFISKEQNEKKQGKISWPFNTYWFLGDNSQNGFRTRVILPILRFFRCEKDLPVCYFENNNSQRSLMVKFPTPEEIAQASGEPEVDQDQPSENKSKNRFRTIETRVGTGVTRTRRAQAL